jgi:hypothetical protein
MKIGWNNNHKFIGRSVAHEKNSMTLGKQNISTIQEENAGGKY